jgi:predicted Fe-Mo cluster-binding NifX family protein
MRVAISTDGEMVAAHFGRCEAYTIGDIEDGAVMKTERIANPGHEPGFLPGYLAKRGVECIVAGGMGPRAHGLFAERGIQTVVGVSGSIADALDGLAKGDLEGGESSCDHCDH